MEEPLSFREAFMSSWSPQNEQQPVSEAGLSSWRDIWRWRISRSAWQRGTGQSLTWHCMACNSISAHSRLEGAEQKRKVRSLLHF